VIREFCENCGVFICEYGVSDASTCVSFDPDSPRNKLPTRLDMSCGELSMNRRKFRQKESSSVEIVWNGCQRYQVYLSDFSSSQ